MEVILDELRRNEVDIDMRTLSYHINDCLERYEFAFRALPIPTESFDIAILFHKIEVINFGRAMVFYQYLQSLLILRSCFTRLKSSILGVPWSFYPLCIS